MRERVLVAGLGRFGLGVARKMVELGHEVCGVDRDPTLVSESQDELTLALVADLTDADAVREVVGAAHYDLAVVAIGTDLESSLQAALHLREAGIPRIVAKALSPTHGKLLSAIGVNRVVYPEQEAGERLALELGMRGVIRALPMVAGLEVAEAKAPELLVGKTLSELAVRQRYGVTVLTIQRGDQVIAPPTAETELRSGDTLMLLGRPRDLQRLLNR